jgi:hypothetical protein
VAGGGPGHLVRWCGMAVDIDAALQAAGALRMQVSEALA